MFWRTSTYFQKNHGHESVTLEIRNEKLIIDGYVIGDEERLLSIFDKANKYDELKAQTNSKGGA